MILDHGGPDLGFILYGASLKLWVTLSVLVGVTLPTHGWNPFLAGIAGLAAMLALAAGVGVVESSLARLRMVRVPQLLVAAGVFGAVALFLALKG